MHHYIMYIYIYINFLNQILIHVCITSTTTTFNVAKLAHLDSLLQAAERERET